MQNSVRKKRLERDRKRADKEHLQNKIDKNLRLIAQLQAQASLDRTEQTKLQKDIDKIEVFLTQYSAYDVSRADPREETGIIEVHEDFSWEDALAHFLARMRWILKALRASMIIPNTDEVGVQYITVQVGFGQSVVAPDVKKSFKRM